MTEELNISTSEVFGESSPRRCADPNCPFQKSERVSASDYATMAKQLSDLAKSGGLEPPVFQSPTRLPNTDRTIRRRKNGTAVIAINLLRRTVEDVQSDMIDGIITATSLDTDRAERFRTAAQRVLEQAAIPSSDSQVASVQPITPVTAEDTAPTQQAKRQRARGSKRAAQIVEPIELNAEDDSVAQVPVESAA